MKKTSISSTRALMKGVPFFLSCLIILASSGCTSYRITSEPAGAMIKFKSPNMVSWDAFSPTTPCKVTKGVNWPYGFDYVAVKWANGRLSDWRLLDKDMHFVQKRKEPEFTRNDSRSTAMHIAEQPSQDIPNDYEEGFSKKTFDIQWGDSAKKVESVLGRPSKSGPARSGEHKVLIYHYGKDGGEIRFVFGSEGTAMSQRKSMTDELSLILVLPKNISDMSVEENASLVRAETPQTLPRIEKAKGFLGDFLQSKGLKSKPTCEAPPPVSSRPVDSKNTRNTTASSGILRSSSILPPFKNVLIGSNEVRIKNPNNFSVTVGLRSGRNGRDFQVVANGIASVFVPNGAYEIFFVYSDRPDDLFKGDDFSLKDNGVEIQITQVVGGNYGIQRVK